MRHNDSQNSPIVLVGPNFRVGMKIGHGNFGDIRLGKTYVVSLFNLLRPKPQ